MKEEAFGKILDREKIKQWQYGFMVGFPLGILAMIIILVIKS